MGFQQGLSGLNASAKSLSVIGNNIANANTVGAKSSRAEFADLYAASLNGAGSSPVGIGVTVEAVAQQFTQGNISATENPMDLAINGAGFFQVQDANGQTYFTRNGEFKIDNKGYVVNNAGLKLAGINTKGDGTLGPIQLSAEGVAPNKTRIVTIAANLDTRQDATKPASGPAIDLINSKTYNNSTSQTVYDLKGQDVALTYYFQKAPTTDADKAASGVATWNVYVAANGEIQNGTADDPQPMGVLEFDRSGKLLSAPATMSIASTDNGKGKVTEPIEGIKLDFTGLTQFGANFGVTTLRQDGYAPGQLAGFVVEENGNVLARYSNGQSRDAAQLELANFRNPQGLQPLGGNLWAKTQASGDRIPGFPGAANMGVLQAGAVEESNVDLTAELVNMITAQRSYQANAQTIKTEDQVMQTLVNLR